MRFEFNDDSQKICNSADVVNYGIQCDICGNKFQSVSNINGRRYCVGCYYKTFMKDNQKAEINQLKQQLEEYKNKENTSAVNSWDEMLKNCENCGLNECIGCEYTQTCVQNIKQQLAEKDKEIAHLKEKDNYHLRYELAGADETITNLKEQLAEKDCRIEELEGQFAYECECNKQLVELQKQLEKKQNEIAELEQELTELKEKMQEEISRREIYFISWLGNKVCKGFVIGYNEEDKFIIICGEDMISTNEIFAYEQEAQAKLKEIQGNE